jgi:hypothetical protein
MSERRANSKPCAQDHNSSMLVHYESVPGARSLSPDTDLSISYAQGLTFARSIGYEKHLLAPPAHYLPIYAQSTSFDILITAG